MSPRRRRRRRERWVFWFLESKTRRGFRYVKRG